ncbi:peptidoglycan editing factor PgeF [Staphylococcus xylosus]
MQDKFKKKHHILEYEDDYLKNIKLGITTREDGFSPFPRNAFNMARYIGDNQQNITQHQEMLATAIEFPREQWVFPIQTHENKVVEITEQDRGTNIDSLTDRLHGVDALYTYDENILLTMCYADCVPIYFYSEKHHFIGLAHAGWRGTVGQIVIEMISHLDFELSDLSVVIGPATSSSYEINDDIKSKFEALPIDINQYIETRDVNRHGIDLKLANALLLENAGVPKSNIYITDYATSEDLSLFFSYRVEKGNTGRMLAFIGQ